MTPLLLATRIAHVHHFAGYGLIETLLYFVAVIATVLAVLGLVLSLFARAGSTRQVGHPVLLNWVEAAVVAIIAWIALVILF